MKRATIMFAGVVSLPLAPSPAVAQAQQASAPSSPKPVGPYSSFIAAGDLVFLSGQIAIDPATGLLDRNASIEAQTRQVLKNVQATLRAAGLELSDIVNATVYLTDIEDFSRMNAAYAEALGPVRPARTTVAVQALPMGARIEIAVVAAGRPGP